MGLRAHFGGSDGGRLLRRRGGLAVTFFLCGGIGGNVGNGMGESVE